ncbi:MAG: STAS/SEC14 domain-containing protein [Chitinophagaceae bacterium]|nr:STAS/SEC14 domain-containing protein [Chitinophagaceae bacterium]
MEIPEDRPVFDGEIATYWFDHGILVSLSKPVKRTVENIGRNVALVKEITGNQPMPLLIYLKNSPVPDKQTRKYSTEQLPVIYKAMAMVSKPGLASFIMKLLFGLQSPPIPMKHFTNENEARAWLQQYL